MRLVVSAGFSRPAAAVAVFADWNFPLLSNVSHPVAWVPVVPVVTMFVPESRLATLHFHVLFGIAGVPVGAATCFSNLTVTSCDMPRVSYATNEVVIVSRPADDRPLRTAPRSRFELGELPNTSAFEPLKTRAASPATVPALAREILMSAGAPPAAVMAVFIEVASDVANAVRSPPAVSAGRAAVVKVLPL